MKLDEVEAILIRNNLNGIVFRPTQHESRENGVARKKSAIIKVEKHNKESVERLFANSTELRKQGDHIHVLVSNDAISYIDYDW